MENGEHLVIFTTPSKDDGVRLQIEKTVDTHGKHRDLRLKQLPHMETALQALRDGRGDIVAMSAFDWIKHGQSDLSIVGVLPRKEPTWVLVSPDKPEYLKNGALLMCDHELVRRQMKRFRPDVRLLSMHEIVKELKHSDSFNSLDEDDIWPWFEQRLLNGEIDGFIVPRSVHAGHKMKSRRHTLGLQRDQTEIDRERFIPPPLYGFTLLVAREGFPKTNVREMVDSSAELAYRLEVTMTETLDPKLQQITGFYAEQRKVATFLKKANEDGDDTLLTSLVDPNQKRGRLYQGGPRVELLIETLDPTGRFTACCERIVLPEHGHNALITLLKDFLELLNIMTTDHDATKRIIPGMPHNFNQAKPRLMDLGV